LEDELYRSRECRSDLAERFGNTQAYGCVHVVTARMLHSVALGPVRHCIHFLNWQGIHIGPHCDRSAGTVSFEDPDDASVRDAGLNRKAEALEMLGHDARRSELPVTEFWMLVQVPANPYKLRLKRYSKTLNLAIGH
jgi:hypothetical protein